jgi:hypothetical protein
MRQRNHDLCGCLTELHGFCGNETGACSATCDGDGTEEVGVKVEEAIDTGGEIPEVISFPEIKTEPEVRLWGFL